MVLIIFLWNDRQQHVTMVIRYFLMRILRLWWPRNNTFDVRYYIALVVIAKGFYEPQWKRSLCIMAFRSNKTYFYDYVMLQQTMMIMICVFCLMLYWKVTKNGRKLSTYENLSNSLVVFYGTICKRGCDHKGIPCGMDSSYQNSSTHKPDSRGKEFQKSAIFSSELERRTLWLLLKNVECTMYLTRTR